MLGQGEPSKRSERCGAGFPKCVVINFAEYSPADPDTWTLHSRPCRPRPPKSNLRWPKPGKTLRRNSFHPAPKSSVTSPFLPKASPRIGYWRKCIGWTTTVIVSTIVVPRCMIGRMERSAVACTVSVSLLTGDPSCRVLNVYADGGQDLTSLIVATYERYCASNPLHPDVFPTIRKMEAEVVSMCLRSVAFLASSHAGVYVYTSSSQAIQ